MYIKEIKNINLYNDYSNMTIKDNFLHILNKNKIHIYDLNGNKIEEKELSNEYKLLTYNSDDNNYLMHVGDSSRIYIKLNFNYEEYDMINENTFGRRLKKITDIYYDNEENKYLVANENQVYSFDALGNYLKNEINVNEFFNIPINDMSYVPDFTFSGIAKDNNYKYVSYNENGSNFIAKLSKKGNLIENLFISDEVKINSLVPVNNMLYALGNDGENNYLYIIGDGSGSINPKVNEIIDRIIVLTSNVSDSENAIASIINAEANKIKRVLTVTDDPNVMLAVNESANEMIKTVGELENNEYINLQKLLESILELEQYLNQ